MGKKIRTIKVWLVRDKRGKMRRSIWFYKEHATIIKEDYQEVIPVKIKLCQKIN